MKRPLCNFCGSLCDYVWYSRKSQSASSLLARQIREKETLESFGEQSSLQNVLKELTNSYVLCKDCFDQGNYPKVFSTDDFEPQTMKSILDDDNVNDSEAEQEKIPDENE